MPKPTTSQKNAFKKLQTIDEKAEIRWDEKTGAPARVRGVFSDPQEGAPEVVARQFLAATKSLFAMDTPEQELQFKGVGSDPRGNQHVRFQQTYKGLPVFGGELIVHMTGNNAVQGVNSKYMPRMDISTDADITPENAVEIMVGHDTKNHARDGDEPILLILPHEGENHLAWHMTVEGTDTALDGTETPAMWAYFVDAHSGEVIWRYNNEQTHSSTSGSGNGRYAGAVGINTLHNHTTNKYELEDRWTSSTARIITHDAANGYPPKPVSEDGNNNWSATSQREEVDCHLFTRTVYDYFRTTHGRNSYDNAGADMHIYAHVGSNWNNASWNGSYVKIGDGDGTSHNPYCTLDIVAHEWTHAVTQHEANLVYSGESGALNESFSDVFAALIDGDWLHGEDNWLAASAPAGRNLADPTNGGQYDNSSFNNALNSVLAGHQPDHMNEKWNWAQDYGGVHVNSGIMNKAAYLIATGGTHRGITICEGLGRDMLGRLYYQALTNHLTASSDFADMRDAVLDSLDDLYAGNSRYNRWRASIINAFAAVGIGTAIKCPLACYTAPLTICHPGPLVACYIGPSNCPPAPVVACAPAPTLVCPTAPITLACPPAPLTACPPAPLAACPPSPAIACPPGPIACLPGPDPTPFNPKMRDLPDED